MLVSSFFGQILFIAAILFGVVAGFGTAVRIGYAAWNKMERDRIEIARLRAEARKAEEAAENEQLHDFMAEKIHKYRIPDEQ